MNITDLYPTPLAACVFVIAKFVVLYCFTGYLAIRALVAVVVPGLAMVRQMDSQWGRDEMRGLYRDRMMASCFKCDTECYDVMGKLLALHPTTLPGKPLSRPTPPLLFSTCHTKPAGALE